MTEPSEKDDQAAQDEGAKSATSPGEMMRSAREALNLTISDLAGQTRLTRAVLEALEKNDFASLAMPVYVRGYFRKCAHVLNLPEDKLLNAYADWTGTPPTPQPLPVVISDPPEEYVSSDRSPSWRYALIIAVLLGAALWWFGSGDSTPPASATDEKITTLPVEPKPVATQPLPLPPVNEIAQDQREPELTGEPATGASEVPDAADTSEAEPATATDESGDDALPPIRSNTLQVIITATSWVEVYDDEDRQLVYGLLQPGTEQRVAGNLPYKVILGHPQGVKLSLGGEAIDLEEYTRRDGTARLRVKGP